MQSFLGGVNALRLLRLSLAVVVASSLTPYSAFAKQKGEIAIFISSPIQPGDPNGERNCVAKHGTVKTAGDGSKECWVPGTAVPAKDQPPPLRPENTCVVGLTCPN